MKEINEISTNDAIYIAGLFDGEGCISLTKCSRIKERYKTPTFTLRARIRMTDSNIINWLYITIGGNYYGERNPTSRRIKSPNGKPYFEWGVAGRNAIEFLKQIYPYLKVKHLQAEIAFKFGNTIKYCYGKLPNDIVNQRAKLRSEMISLNHRGLSTITTK